MQVMYKICCGIDVHKMKIVCCLKKGNKQEIREFSAETKELRSIARWLEDNKCEMIAMESTGSFWKPLWNVFEDEGLKQMLCNAKDMKNVPGKKTDIKDSEWICDLLQHGLLKASYIPDRDQRELRELIKYRESMIEERTRELNRLQKMLEGANIKVVSKFSKLENKTCRGLIDYILKLEEEEEIEEKEVKKLINKNVKSSLEDIMIAMEGVVTPLQKELMKKVIEHINDMAERIEELNEMVNRYMSKYEENIKKLEKIPGIGRRNAQVILADKEYNVGEIIYACGPYIVLKTVAQMGERFGIETQVAMEKVMAFSIGVYRGCVIDVLKDGKVQNASVCKDGPIFNGKEVVWK